LASPDQLFDDEMAASLGTAAPWNARALAENRIAASAHAILDDALFTAFGCRLGISAAADQSGEGADARAKERISTDRAGDCTKSATAGCTQACILGDIRIVAGCACRLLARGEVAVICFLGMTAHLDDGAIVSTAASTCG
jgi:hypothetical protein